MAGLWSPPSMCRQALKPKLKRRRLLNNGWPPQRGGHDASLIRTVSQIPQRLELGAAIGVFFTRLRAGAEIRSRFGHRGIGKIDAPWLWRIIHRHTFDLRSFRAAAAWARAAASISSRALRASSSFQTAGGGLLQSGRWSLARSAGASCGQIWVQSAPSAAREGLMVLSAGSLDPRLRGLTRAAGAFCPLDSFAAEGTRCGHSKICTGTTLMNPPSRRKRSE